MFDQIEKDIWRERLQFLPQEIDIVIDGQMLRCVPHRAERFHHIRLGLPLFRFQFVAEILVDGRRTCAVEQNENLEFLLHVLFLVRYHSERSEAATQRTNSARPGFQSQIRRSGGRSP
ncbi:MAG: hypothetical protein DMF00_16090 [Verrucomicrobia bacterium]|nr:MAG: hypothetical protein DMF00_16090 [Verrucomicrobiota bacterium]